MTNIFLQVGTPEWDQVLSIVRAETRTTILKELDDSKDVWLTTSEAILFMKVKSKKTLAKYRDERDSPIVYSEGTYLKSSLHKYKLWKKK